MRAFMRVNKIRYLPQKFYDIRAGYQHAFSMSSLLPRKKRKKMTLGYVKSLPLKTNTLNTGKIKSFLTMDGRNKQKKPLKLYFVFCFLVLLTTYLTPTKKN